MDLFLYGLPWIAVASYLILVFRSPRDLSVSGGRGPEEGPLVSIIVPARDEEENIGRCVDSLADLDYPAFEVLVVDDGSRDRTAEIVDGVARKHPGRVKLIPGEPLPEGWFGKPWACWQGAQHAKGRLLLFTDADTVHAPGLLTEAVRGLTEDEADALTVIGRQIMVSFWERLLQPQFFMLLAARYPRTGTPRRPHHWKHAIANGQYILFKREVYDASGGHRAVAGEVVEDLRLAQLLVRGGWRLTVRATDGLETRMYRTLGGLVEGWSKNVATAALQTTASWLIPVILPLSLFVGIVLWLFPPAVLIWGLAVGMGGTMLLWSALAVGLSLVVWSRASALMKGNPLFGFLYPLGAVLAQYIFIKSWRRGTRIRWKGRSYEMPRPDRTRPPGRSDP